MLRLAKPESKKEMSLKKKKKANNNISLNNKHLTERNSFYHNYNSSKDKNSRIQHKIVKKAEKPKNIFTNNFISKPNSIIILKNKKNLELKTTSPNKPISPIRRIKNKRIFSLKKIFPNQNNLQKCESLRNNSKKNNINDNKCKKNFSYRAKTETEEEHILKTVQSGRIRKLYSMASNIFNLDNTATNLIKRINLSPKLPKYYNVLFKRDDKNNYPDEMSYRNNNNINILSHNILGITRKKQGNKFNRINFFIRNEFNPSETNSFNSKGKKTNRANIESVKYDIISTNKSNLFEKYNNLSGIKASSSKIEDYEIIIPKNYNKSNVYKFKNILNSSGIHAFGLKEEGDIIGGQKGKFLIKVRVNGQSEKEKNKMINKASNRLMNLNVKLKRNLIDWGKKKTDITGNKWLNIAY